MQNLSGRKIMITGAAKRLGHQFALTAAKAGAAVIVHHGHSPSEAQELCTQIKQQGGYAEAFQADLSDPEEAMQAFNRLFKANDDFYALVNNAAIFKPVKFADTTLSSWRLHMDINLTMPFLLSQAFAHAVDGKPGRIINILDWRALRPGIDHFPYTISKSALAAMTKALAGILAPNIQVNGLALGAILPPSDGNTDKNITKNIPAGRWAEMEELEEVFTFLLTGPDYITGEIIHLDGGRHLV